MPQIVKPTKSHETQDLHVERDRESDTQRQTERERDREREAGDKLGLGRMRI